MTNNNMFLKPILLLFFINIIIYVFFSLIYLYLYTQDKQSHFLTPGYGSLIDMTTHDIFYFSAVTHTVGYGDIVPRSFECKSVVMVHLFLIMLVNAWLVVSLRPR